MSRRGSGAAATAAGAMLFALASSLASGACSSLPDIRFDEDASALFPDGGGTEGGIKPNCQRTGPEDCNDGIDNDCNGKTDCQDFTCRQQGYSCQDVPNGWTAVSFSATARPSCPDGTNAVDLKVAAGDGMSAACACSCKAASGSCATGSFTVVSANDGACSTTPTMTTVPVSTSACTALGTNLALGSRAMITEPPPPASCVLTSALDAPLTDGRLCEAQTGAASTGGGCGANQICAHTGGQAFTSCISMAGKSACPATFPTRSTAGTGATDGRSCSGCACGAPAPCTGGTVSLYGSSMCKTNGGFQHADNIGTSCGQLAPDPSFTATFYKSTPPTGGGCGALTSQGTVTGLLGFANERTICCR